jgi:hypothetical protein
MKYQKLYGSGGSEGIFAAMMNHVNIMARDIAAMEVLGPNPGLTLEAMIAFVRKEGMNAVGGLPALFPTKSPIGLPSATETKQDMAAIMQTQALLKKRREEELRRANKPPVVIFTQEASEDVDDSEAPRVEILDDGEEPEEEPPKKKLVPSPTAPERPKIPEPTTPLPRSAPKSPAPQAPTKPAPQGGRNELAIGGRSIILKQPLADESESEDEGESEESGVRVEKDDIDDFLS